MPYGTLGQLAGGRPTGRSGPFIPTPPIQRGQGRMPGGPMDEAPMLPQGRGQMGGGMRQGEGYQNWLMGHRGGGMRNRPPQAGQMQQAPSPRNPFMPTPGTGFPGPMNQPMPQMPQGDVGMIPGGGYTGGQPWQPDRTGGMAPWMGQQLPMQPPQAGGMSPWQGGIERFRRRSQF